MELNSVYLGRDADEIAFNSGASRKPIREKDHTMCARLKDDNSQHRRRASAEIAVIKFPFATTNRENAQAMSEMSVGEKSSIRGRAADDSASSRGSSATGKRANDHAVLAIS
jgi:hypothetical protein